MSIRRIHDKRGFTLIELIIVIVLAGILAVLGGIFIARPIEGFVAQSRRARLTDGAELALRRLQRDVRNALPNSIRISPVGGNPANGSVIEMINIKAAGRYRTKPGPGIGHQDCRFRFAQPDASFAVVNNFNSVSLAAGDRLVVSNWSATGTAANAYFGDNISPVATSLSLDAASALCGGEDRLSLSAPFSFPFPSSYQRFFIVDEPIAYLYDAAARTLNRFAGHSLQASPGAVDTAAELIAQGAGSALVSREVSACNFSYSSGSSQRGGLVTLELTLEDVPSGERVRLLHQMHVDNAP